jgi:putative FmdB family regulatory protein
MPIYEFTCGKCHTLFRFFSRVVDTEKIPSCPRCRTVKLRRAVSSFSSPSGKGEEGEEGTPSLDEAKIGEAISLLEREGPSVDEKAHRRGGPQDGRRPGRGAAPPGAVLGEDEPFVPGPGKRRRPGRRKPRVDEKLYEL